MATQTQREFKKQMKQFEKEGKIPEGYFPRRRRLTYTSGASILLILYILWQTGLLGFIPALIYSLTAPRSIPSEQAAQQSPADMAGAIADTLFIGMPRNDVGSLAGATPAKVSVSAGSGEVSYRYDIIKDDDYAFTGEASKSDTVDIDGMLNGRVRLILFARFDSGGLLDSYTLYYTGEDAIYEIRNGVRSQIYAY